MRVARPLSAMSGSHDTNCCLSDRSFYERDRDRGARLRLTVKKSPSAGAPELKVLGHDQFESNQSPQR